MSFCPNCGTQIPDGSRFCPNCGAPAGGGYQQQPQQQYQQQYQQQPQQQPQGRKFISMDNFRENTARRKSVLKSIKWWQWALIALGSTMLIAMSQGW